MVARIVGFIVFGAALAACSGPAILGPSSGTVTGHVIMHACGGTAYRGQTNICSFRPVAGARISFQSNGNVVTTTTDSNGSYQLALRPGIYSGKATGAPSARVVGPHRVMVTAGKTITVDFTYVVQYP